ncbi:hypothetical protein [uncultured Campylobacter sp.]|uniref:hypothetical protein n=1 Tax=uncultured Campylobacter sp. TaxID=218934 RepID=UPI0026197EA5|nr:hypothetical protein [uncultured Campylobacter sp.]
MGFKKVSAATTKSEENFINQARGETSEIKKPKNLKRDKSFLLYFTQDEFERVKLEAEKIGMGINQYIRFKIFS